MLKFVSSHQRSICNQSGRHIFPKPPLPPMSRFVTNSKTPLSPVLRTQFMDGPLVVTHICSSLSLRTSKNAPKKWAGLSVDNSKRTPAIQYTGYCTNVCYYQYHLYYEVQLIIAIPVQKVLLKAITICKSPGIRRSLLATLADIQ